MDAGRYQLSSEIGEGGEGGTVFAAEHADLGRPIAIKVWSSGASGNHRAPPDPKAGRILAELRRPNLVDVLDSGLLPDGRRTSRWGARRAASSASSWPRGSSRWTSGSTSSSTLPSWVVYASPESIAGKPDRSADDTYALAVILYTVVCGALPWSLEGLTLMEGLAVRMKNEAVPLSVMAAPSGRSCSPALEALITKALSRDPKKRYQSAADLAAALADHT